MQREVKDNGIRNAKCESIKRLTKSKRTREGERERERD
jgi:hypothetical protein